MKWQSSIPLYSLTLFDATFFTYVSSIISIRFAKALRILRHVGRSVAPDGRFAVRKALAWHVSVTDKAPCYAEVALPSVPNLETSPLNCRAKSFKWACARVKECNLRIVESLDWPGTKTKDMARRLDEMGWDHKTLFVTGKDVIPTGLKRSTENLHKTNAMTAQQLGVYDLVKWPRVVLDIEAVQWFEHQLSKIKSSQSQSLALL
jgi:hypothetical protein